MRKWIRDIVFVLMVFVFCLPLIQQSTNFIRIKELHKSGLPPSYPDFSIRAWVDGSFQEGTEKAIEQRVGFRPLLIRIKNQLEYSFFRKANARGVIVGKKGYLFEEDYLRAYSGGDYPGDWFWKEKFRRAGLVMDTLLNLGVKTAVVVEPSKASYYSEFIPDDYIRDSAGFKNNYRSIVQGCKNEHIPVLDLYSYFNGLRDQATYPLFPKGGIHWSYYGMLTAMDTLLPLVEMWTDKKVPAISYPDLRPEAELRGTDGDLADLMNLLIDPSHPDMTYPDIGYQQVTDSLKPRVLAISDSFYFNILNSGIPDSAFSNTAFWYYNVEIYPETWSSRKDTSMIDFRAEIESMDLVMIMITERFFYKFAWTFFDRLFDIYYPEAAVDYRYHYTSRVMSHSLWFDQVVEQSANEGKSLEEGLEDHSGYQFWQDEQKGLLVKNQSYYEMKIRHNEGWMEAVRERAVKNGISTDEQVQLEAAWTLKNSEKQ